MIEPVLSGPVEPGTVFAAYAPLALGWDELFASPAGIRPSLRHALSALLAVRPNDLARAQALAERSLLNQGVTFSVYSDDRGAEKIFPFDLVPRVIAASDWQVVERGLEQRIRALEAFLDDIYGEQRILSSRRVPPEIILGAKHYMPELRGVKAPRGVRIHVAGIDLIRDPDGRRVGLQAPLPDGVRAPDMDEHHRDRYGSA